MAWLKPSATEIYKLHQASHQLKPKKTNTMNIEEIKTAATAGDIDKIYQLIESESPSDSEREQLKEIANHHIDSNPEVAVAMTLGTDEEFGRGIYESLLKKNQVAALKAMRDGEIPGSDTPFEDDLLTIAEHCSPEVWDWVIAEASFMDQLEEPLAEVIGAAAVVAAEKNPALFEKLKTAAWTWEKLDGNEGYGGVGVLGALHSEPATFQKLIAAYQPYLGECAVAAAEKGRIDNLEVLATAGYDLTQYPLDPDNGTLADIASINNENETVEWLLSKGCKRDF
jgi:hypothetical protein